MPFVLRTTETPPLNQLVSLEQIVLVDKTGPSIPVGISGGIACMIGEFLKGPFFTTEVTSTANLIQLFGGVSNLLSQKIDMTQDGSGARYEGNGAIALSGKQFLRLALQRVYTDMAVTDTVGASRAYVNFTVYINTADTDPLSATAMTGKEIVIPAGTRFADAPIGTETGIVVLSQDIVIPKGTFFDVLTPPTGFAGRIRISPVPVNTAGAEAFAVVQDRSTGQLILSTDPNNNNEPATGVPFQIGATAFFVKNFTLASAALDTAIDTAIPNTSGSIIGQVGADAPSSVTITATATAIFAPPGTTAAIGASLTAHIESQYAGAINATVPAPGPTNDITVLWSARRGSILTPSTTADTSEIIRDPLVNNAINSSSEGRGRIAIVSGPATILPAQGTGAVGDGTSTTDTLNRLYGTGAYAGEGTIEEFPGNGVESADRRIIAFPYNQVFSSDLGKLVTIAPDGWMAATLSQFPEEKNPGARNVYIQAINNFELAFQLLPLVRQDYVNLKAKGVAALRKDRSVGWWFQSGVTSVNPAVLPTRAPIKRRRMADLIQDTLAEISAKYNKEPATIERVDSLVGDCDSFLSSLKSEGIRSKQRIEDYSIDAINGNQPQLVAIGIFTIIVKVRLLASLDTIVFETQIGETVEIEAA
jgi:hypothetical protein